MFPNALHNSLLGIRGSRHKLEKRVPRINLVENPKALGFHQETMKHPIEETETTEDSSDPRIGFVSNPILFTRENYYKFWLQYKNSKSKSLF